MRSAATRCSGDRKIRARCSGVSEIVPSWLIRLTISSPSIGSSDIEGVVGQMRQIGVPMLRDLQPGRHPDALVLSDVIEEAHQRSGAAGTADDPAMQADRHHLRRGFAFPVKDVKAVLQIGEEFIAAAKPLRIHKAHVVGIERIGNDQMRLRPARLDPVRQVVGIGVAEIKQAAGFHQKPAAC